MSSRPKRIKWSEDDMRNAILDYHNKLGSIRQIATLYNVPKSTLQDRVSENIDSEKLDSRPGRRPILGEDGESEIVDHTKTMGDHTNKLLVTNSNLQMLQP